MTLLKERPDVRPSERTPSERPTVRRRRMRRIVGWSALAALLLAGGVALTMWLTGDDTDPAAIPASDISTGYLVKLPSGEYQVVPRSSVDAMNPSTGYLVKLPSGEYMVVPRSTTGTAMIPATTFIELPSGEYMEVPLSDAAIGGLIDPSTQGSVIHLLRHVYTPPALIQTPAPSVDRPGSPK